MTRKRERACVLWTPKWDGEIKSWSIKFLRNNKWRCDSIHDMDDLLQDAYLIFIKLCDKYPRVVDAPHFMALYKSSISNRMHDRASYMQRKREQHQETDRDVSEVYTNQMGEASNGGYVGVLLNEAPDELKAAIKLLLQSPEVLKQPRHPKFRKNLNMKLREVLGVPTNYDFVGGIRELFQ